MQRHISKEKLLSKLTNVREAKSKDGCESWTADCPGCGHTNKHFRLWYHKNYVGCHCFCCDINGKQLMKIVDANEYITKKVTRKQVNHGKEIEHINYGYIGHNRTFEFFKTRIKYEDGHKTMFFWRYVLGKKVYGKPDGSTCLFNLPALFKAIDENRNKETLFIVEGEKCAMALINFSKQLGNKNPYLVTSASNGAKSKLTEKDKAILKLFPNKVLLLDNDEPGHTYVKAFEGVGPIKIIDMLNLWPNCPKGGDIADYLEEELKCGC